MTTKIHMCKISQPPRTKRYSPGTRPGRIRDWAQLLQERFTVRDRQPLCPKRIAIANRCELQRKRKFPNRYVFFKQVKDAQVSESRIAISEIEIEREIERCKQQKREKEKTTYLLTYLIAASRAFRPGSRCSPSPRVGVSEGMLPHKRTTAGT